MSWLLPLLDHDPSSLIPQHVTTLMFRSTGHRPLLRLQISVRFSYVGNMPLRFYDTSIVNEMLRIILSARTRKGLDDLRLRLAPG
jgi:hypothetical protein